MPALFGRTESAAKFYEGFGGVSLGISGVTERLIETDRRFCSAAAMLEQEDHKVIVDERNEGGLRVHVHAGGLGFVADEPIEAGGLGSGPNPYDLLGAALGACIAMTLRVYAARKGWPLEGVHVAVRHEWRDGDVFSRTVRLDGPLDDAQRERLLQIAARCPVHRTLTNGARIEAAA